MYKTNLVSLNLKTITFPGILYVKTTEYKGNNPSLNHLYYFYISTSENIILYYFFRSVPCLIQISVL